MGFVVESSERRVLGKDDRRLESGVEVEERSEGRSRSRSLVEDFRCVDLYGSLLSYGSFLSDLEESRLGESRGLSRSLSRSLDGMLGRRVVAVSFPRLLPEHNGALHQRQHPGLTRTPVKEQGPYCFAIKCRTEVLTRNSCLWLCDSKNP